MNFEDEINDVSQSQTRSDVLHHEPPRCTLARGMNGVEAYLTEALRYEHRETPPQLRAALRDAMFPGGARLRPSLCLAVGLAHGIDVESPVLIRCASSVELIHGASLVHDDLPCFDNAATRRGHPSVHAKYGEAMAVLVGDALIVQAFRTLADPGNAAPMAVIAELAVMAGAARGLVAGQAWELEPHSAAGLRTYHRCKTAALFEFAAYAGAAVAQVNPSAWAVFGQHVGLTYQLLDDLVDYVGDEESIGKPSGQDARLERPNAVQSYGLASALERLRAALSDLEQGIPACPQPMAVQIWIAELRARITPFLERAQAIVSACDRKCSTNGHWCEDAARM
jgi:geranylgeranyl diphosphate synthase type II